MALARYVGGPCDGRVVLGEIGDDRICGGVSYTLGGDGNYHPGSSGGGPVGVEALGLSGPKGWADLRRTIGGTVPTYTRKTQLLARATRRRIATRRRHR